MFTKIKSTCDQLVQVFNTIPDERKVLLEKIAHYISEKKDNNLPIQLMYVCTHNSRRSHFGQIWAAVASEYFHVNNVTTFSGGTEATAFNPNAIQALREIGFDIHAKDQTSNPMYEVFFSEKSNPSRCFKSHISMELDIEISYIELYIYIETLCIVSIYIHRNSMYGFYVKSWIHRNSMYI